MNHWIEGTVVRNIRWTQALCTLEVDAQLAPFQAGQFTKLALFDEQQGKKISRAYSFVNGPKRYPHEFLIVAVEDGLLSPKLDACEAGSTLWLKEQAAGFLTLDEMAKTRDLWMLATGTGLSPFLSLLDAGEVWQQFEQIFLVHGVRHAEDLVYQQRIQTWLNTHKNQLHYQPMVSREHVDGVLQGRIPAAIENHLLQQACGADFSPENSHVLLCGNPDMIKDTQAVLQSFGLEKHLRRKPGHISLEKYW